MMKKIKRIKGLRQEQRKLSQREAELEEFIHHDWIEVKEAAKLKNILANMFKREKDNERPRKRSWLESLGYHAGKFAQRMLEDKIEMKISQKIESLVTGLFCKIKNNEKKIQVRKGSGHMAG